MKRAGRTSITRVELAADAIHRLALSPRGDAATIDALRALPDLQRWHPGLLDAAIDQLVTTGALAENSSGRLIWAPRSSGDAT